MTDAYLTSVDGKTVQPDLRHMVHLPGLDGGAKLQTPQALGTWGVNARFVQYDASTQATFESLVAQVRSSTDDLPPFVLVGESFSAAIALRFAQQYPDRVLAVVLIAGFVAPPVPRLLNWIVGEWAFRLPVPRLAVRVLLTGRRSSAELNDRVLAAVHEVPPATMVRRMRMVLATDHTTVLRPVECPLLCVHGTKDRLVRRDSLERIVQLQPHAKSAAIDGPHMLAQTRPGEVARAIDDFLSTLPTLPREPFVR